MGAFDIPSWLEGMPLAPEFRPTDTEFADPIAYVSKIEKEVGPFGICKVIPPLPKPSKKYVFSNLNKSLSKCPELGSRRNTSSDLNSTSEIGSSDGVNDGEIRAVFTTRQQELGQNAKKSKAGAVQNPPSVVHKQVWQSGEIYTLEQFEAKSKVFAKSQLGTVKEVSPLVVEAMFWKAASEKPIYLEYANDVPGSGFGEPDGQRCHFHRRRRKRNFFTRVGEGKRDDIVNDRIGAPQDDSGNATSSINGPKSPTSESTLPANEKESTSVPSKKKSQSSCYDKEGSVGWKISNSPWNLQVISRSAGSLTRFMPDDIPGVTSPMVYIGMLFSWFAWHVEDHELHSMNFLHTGSSKTWYSVPGDYAFAFEELVRSEAYGGKFDRIAALALLGEKTTLMSPEVVIASGIPCCRLVQNPGEFVVTFPRAYHVGFSHGFNCGEAANFGTPQWLKVAKEAAVRRAAMNYLPMLSHQQLLYLLTMSFVSRVPRSLLPGVRSSRLRDRQKEERELLVKKAFIEDILQENSVLSALLSKDSGYRAVLWNPDLLTYPSKETLSHTDSKKHDDEHKYFGDDMSLYMENLDDLYLGSDDLSCDFQVDSGTLACVACGILGFPFMSVVQPSEKASLEFLHHDRHGTSGYTKKNLDSSSNGSLKEKLLPSGFEADLMSNDRWNAHNKFLRPRSFCLEHAVEIADLLLGKGGANVLVICHSDYQKIKAHATTISEEIGSPFKYKEVPLDKASKEDLSLIDLAIDNGECHSNSEDWTSKLGINLRHCVKIRKNSPSKQVQHALTLGGLFSNKPQTSDYSAIKWNSRKSRSKKVYYSTDLKARDISESKNTVMAEISCSIKKEVKLIQYTRRNFKRKGKWCESHATLEDRDRSEIESEKVGNFSSLGFSPSDRTSAVQSENETSEIKMDEIRLAASNIDEGTEKSFEVLASEMHSNIEADEDFLVGSRANSSHQLSEERVSITEMENDCPYGQVSHPFTGNDEDTERPVSCTMASIDEFSEGPECSSKEKNLALNPEQIRMEESSNGEAMEVPKETRSIEDHSKSTCLSSEAHQGTEPTTTTTITMEEDSLVPTSMRCEGSSLNIEIQQKVSSLSEELAISSSTQIDCTIIPREKLPGEDMGNDVIREPGSVSTDIAEIGKQPDHEGDSEVLNGEFHANTKIATTFQKYSRVKRDTHPSDNSSNGTTVCNVIAADLSTKKGGKRKREAELLIENNFMSSGYTRSPCEGLRPRATSVGADTHLIVKEKPLTKKRRKPANAPAKDDEMEENSVKPHKCDIEGCCMSFEKKAELSQHKRNRCPYKGCGKRFSSHKYAMIHDRVHSDQRPLKCPWKGCSMSFKWSWARTEHIRVHTGERPYTCTIDGCGLSFRFVSDFSRHRRKTGHYVS